MERDELIEAWKESKIVTDDRVADAFLSVRREEFVMPGYRMQAYDDVALPLVEGQTISQPTTVAMMTQALNIHKGQKVLEVGSGSGYQTAILSELVGDDGKVVSMERIEKLYSMAVKNLKRRKNVKLILGDGSLGHPQLAPYDRIIVTAASPETPNTLIGQLANGGIIVVPITQVYGMQRMTKIRKDENGKVFTQYLGEFNFVPLKGEKGHR
jgi:protein-L-isoaspartate(D-aspartate) O-methyltransferase